MALHHVVSRGRTLLAPVAMAAALIATATGCGSTSSPGAGSTPQPSASASPGGPTATTPPTSDAAAPSGRSSTGSVNGSSGNATSHPTEYNPPGDIPDNAVFTDQTAPGSTVHFQVPEGWAQATQGAVTTYTDKYNSIGIEVRALSSAPTVTTAKTQDVPALQAAATNFKLTTVETLTRKAGPAVHIVFQTDSAPNDVTGKVIRDEVEVYEFWKGGTEAILTLTGPNNADNVDPWRIVSDSVSFA